MLVSGDKKKQRKRPRQQEWIRQISLLPMQDREQVNERYEKRVKETLTGMRQAQPAVCEWLSREEHILPKVVNIVYTVDYGSEHFTPPLNMARVAQYRPNTKHRPPNCAITIRIHPTTALLFAGGNAVLIKPTSPGMALYYSHLYRQDLEQTPFILKLKGEQNRNLFIGTLEGRLGFSIGRIDNIVGSGVLFQDGVHLTNLMQAEDEKVDWEPDAFPNAIYRDVLADGTPFCANIASTGKIVLMGLKTIEGLYEAYRITSDVIYKYEDPNVPLHPKDRYDYRINQLFKQNKLVAASEMDANPADLEGMGDEYDEDERENAEVDSVYSMIMQTVQSYSAPPSALPVGLSAAAATTEPPRDEAYALLKKAADSGLADNVVYLLEQNRDEMMRAVWKRDGETGKTIADRMEMSIDPRHRQILHILRAFMNSNTKKEEGGRQ